MPAVAGFPLDRFCLSNKVLTDSSRLTGSSVKGNLWPSGTILYGSLLNPLRFDHLARGTGSIGTADSLLGYATTPEVRLPRSLGPRGYFRRHS